MKINEAIRKIRKSKGISQEQVADYLKIDTTNYGRIERGQTSVTCERLEQLSNLYQTSVPDIIAMVYGSKKNTETSVNSFAMDRVDELKKEVAFLRELLASKDAQISQLLEILNSKKKSTPK